MVNPKVIVVILFIFAVVGVSIWLIVTHKTGGSTSHKFQWSTDTEDKVINRFSTLLKNQCTDVQANASGHCIVGILENKLSEQDALDCLNNDQLPKCNILSNCTDPDTINIVQCIQQNCNQKFKCIPQIT